MIENLNFGKAGFKTCVFEKHFISYSCILFLLFNVLRSVFKNQVIFSKKMFFPNFQLIQSVFRSIEISFKILGEPLSVSIDWDCFSINQISWIRFLKNRFSLFQKHFFKSSLIFSFSLSDSDLAPPQIFVVFYHSFCKVALSKYRSFYPYFCFYFHISCIFMHFNLGISNLYIFGVFDD